MFRHIAAQSSYFWSSLGPRYFNSSIPSISESPYLQYKLNSISPDLYAISTYHHHRNISVELYHLFICICLHNPVSSMFILHWYQRSIGASISCRIKIMEFQCLYMKCFLSITGFCDLAGHPSTGNSTYFNTHSKDTTYISVQPPPMSAPCVFVMNIL